MAVLLVAPFGLGQDKALNFKNQKIVDRNFSGQELDNVIFEEATITGCTFSAKCSLKSANFSGANLTNVNFYNCVLNDADFAGATYDIGRFGDTKLKKVNFQGVDLSTIDMRDCDLRGGNLSHLKGIRSVDGCLFNGADVRSADLREMKWAAAYRPLFDNARYDSKTRWPVGFDPKEAGAVLEKDAEPLKEIVGKKKNSDISAPKSGTLPKAEKGVRQLDGLYCNFQARFPIAYFFSPEGYLSTSPVGGLEAYDFQAAAKNNPGQVGTYIIQKDTMAFRFGNKEPFAQKISFAKDSFEFGMDTFTLVAAFPAGAKLQGTFEGAMSGGNVSVGGGVARIDRTYIFQKDGTFSLESSGSAGAGAGLPILGPATDGPPVGLATKKSKGTYSLSGNTLKLTTADGKAMRMTIFAGENANREPLLYIDGLFCKKIKD
jgi:hypothetical protein